MSSHPSNRTLVQTTQSNCRTTNVRIHVQQTVTSQTSRHATSRDRHGRDGAITRGGWIPWLDRVGSCVAGSTSIQFAGERDEPWDKVTY